MQQFDSRDAIPLGPKQPGHHTFCTDGGAYFSNRPQWRHCAWGAAPGFGTGEAFGTLLQGLVQTIKALKPRNTKEKRRKMPILSKAKRQQRAQEEEIQG